MEKRKFLKKRILLCGDSDGEKFKRTFNIVKKLSENAVSVRYEAYYKSSVRGILTEFYPKDVNELERNEEGQLVCSTEVKDTYERFAKEKQEFIDSYEMLLDVKKNSESQDLTAFIPPFEIYQGCDENLNVVGTVYIWITESKLETFDKVCEEIHKHPGEKPEHKLVTVLNMIGSLVKCIMALHMSDMVHRDIKPSNFGFIKYGRKILTQAISMSDVGSVRSVYGNFKCDRMVGTEGYIEPEAAYAEADKQTDIYSIGATLFHALIVTDETKDGNYLYRSHYYDRLRELVKDSKLIHASEANSHPKLRNILTIILQKCLCERLYRYKNCEELLEDLETALYYALPSSIALKNRFGEKWILADAEKSLDKNREKNSSLAIQYHLYEKPLYQNISNDETVINVLVIGFGNYGQKFLDSCLQAGQILEKTLNVTVVSDDVTDKEIYLSERPELAEFFDIDGSLSDREDIYGKVTFEISELKRNDPDSNEDILQNIMYDHYGTKPSHYVFIALGEDKLNFSAAKACKKAIETFEMSGVVNYICEGKRQSGQEDEDLCPVYVNDDIKKSALYPEIERMAFNAHLIWEKNLNVDYHNIRANFKKRYNHDSCVSNVLSLKYKLYSVGIDLRQCSFDEAAGLFEKLISDSKNRHIRDELIWIEHRRWVTEKLCLGWHRIRDLKECLGGVTKDEKRKRHICIVRSMPNQKLAEEYNTQNGYEKWDKASNRDLDQLDELDRMSVELHRVFDREAKLVRKQNLLSGNSIAAIKALIKNERIAEAAFQEWFSCLKDIMDGQIKKVRLYKGLKNSFLNAANHLSVERKNLVHEQVEAFESIFFPVLASMEYRDWKQEDVALIDNIPFVLTFSEDVYMVIPYATGGNTKVFGNVAAPTVVNPKRILYLYFAEKETEISELEKSVPYVAEYMRKKHFKAIVELIVIYTDKIAHVVNDDFDKTIRELSDERIKRVKHIELGNVESLPGPLTDYLRQRSSGKKNFTIEENGTGLSYMLKVTEVYKSFSHYRYDSKRMEFSSTVGCDLFMYNKKSPYITVADMFAFRQSSSIGNQQPEFFSDYRELWDMYCRTRSVWKSLCEKLGKHAKENDIIASFKKKSERNKSRDRRKYTYIIPFVCSQSAFRIIDLLKKQDIAEQGSKVRGYTTNSCEVIIFDRCGYETEYDQLFSNVYALMIPEAIVTYLNAKSHAVQVMFNNLVVSGVDISGNRKSEFYNLMKYFKRKGYVINLKNEDGMISFTYATRQIKELLTTAGKMLEVYTYHKAMELDYFDDVVSGFEIDWEGTEVKSEFDCIITKGFRSLFVECKARPQIDQEFYYRISKLTGKFGINATAVLIADTQEKSFYDTASVNAIQRQRGSMVNVITIWKQDEIDDIGETLRKVMDGTYVSKEE